MTVITQNIDGYHERAGNEHVLEVHGTIHRVRCHRRCGFVAAWEQSAVEPFACPACGAPVRPDLVMFGEMLDEEVFAAAEIRSLGADVFFCVGTSFTVQPAARLPVWAKVPARWWWKSIRTRRPCRTPPITRSATAPRSSSRAVHETRQEKPDMKERPNQSPAYRDGGNGRRGEGLIGYNAALSCLALPGLRRPAHFSSRVASRIPCHYRFPDRRCQSGEKLQFPSFAGSADALLIAQAASRSQCDAGQRCSRYSPPAPAMRSVCCRKSPGSPRICAYACCRTGKRCPTTVSRHTTTWFPSDWQRSMPSCAASATCCWYPPALRSTASGTAGLSGRLHLLPQAGREARCRASSAPS
jgi:hypothetical protein